MDDLKNKLLEEQAQLNIKLNKLNNFLKSEKFNTIDKEQQKLLKIQASAMNIYNYCLLERINLL